VRRLSNPLAPLLTLVLFGAGACSTPAATPSAPPSAPPAASTASTTPSGPTPTSSEPVDPVVLAPSVRLTLDASGPIVASDAGPAGRHWVMPAAAARDRDGGFVLFIVWFGDVSGDQLVTVARSDDGRAWRIGTDPILTDLGMDVVQPLAIPTAAMQLDDGSWAMYGWASSRTAPNRQSTWRATAPEPDGPWTLDGAQVIEAGAPGSWDSQTAVAASVHRTADGFGLWYEGEAPGGSARGDIGFATSPDGRAWQKEEAPVIAAGACGAATSLAIEQVQVERWSGGFAAVTAAFDDLESPMALFGLTSPDGRTWSCASTEPILQAAAIPGGQGIHMIASVALEADRFLLIVESLLGSRSELWSAIVEVGD
jgi:hypothetical protein